MPLRLRYASQRLQAHRLWAQAGIPYEAARARLRLADAHLAREDPNCAALELRAGRAAFERLGALPDIRAAERISRQIALRAQQQEGVAHPRRAFMFTDIVGSTPLVEAIGDDAWTDLLRWHDQTLRDLFAAHRGEEINHAGDGFFVAFERSSDALACAIEIQRTLASHRRTHGFSPRLRIGVHADEAADSRIVELKGFAEPVELVAVTWR